RSGVGALRRLPPAVGGGAHQGEGRRPRPLHQAVDRLVSHGLVPAPRGSVEHVGHRTRAGGFMMSGRWGAVLTAMISPFDNELRLDIDGAVAVARYLQDH